MITWINCKDRLPDPPPDVDRKWVYGPTIGIREARHFEFETREFWTGSGHDIWDTDFHFSLEAVTHWADQEPVPEPPKGADVSN